MNNRKWTWAAIGYMTIWAYALSLVVYQIGSIFAGSFGIGSVVGILVLAGIIYLLVRKGYQGAGETVTSVQANK